MTNAQYINSHGNNLNSAKTNSHISPSCILGISSMFSHEWFNVPSSPIHGHAQESSMNIVTLILIYHLETNVMCVMQIMGADYRFVFVLHGSSLSSFGYFSFLVTGLPLFLGFLSCLFLAFCPSSEAKESCNLQ